MAGLSPGQKGAAIAAAVLMAAGGVAKFTAWHEGLRTVGYSDAGRPKQSQFDAVCYGHTVPHAAGKTYSPAQCIRWLAEDELKAGLDITRCLPDELPNDTREAFIDSAYNMGAGTFCKSSMSRKALAGDLPGACAALSLYVYAGGKVLPGLIIRRADERALCEMGLTGAAQ